MANRTGLAGETAAGDGGDDVELAGTVGQNDRLEQEHLQHRTGEILGVFLAVDDDLAGAGLHPDAGNSILALAGGIGAALRIQLLDMNRSSLCRRSDGAEFGEGGKVSH